AAARIEFTRLLQGLARIVADILVKYGGDGGAGVLNVDIDVAGAYRAVADERPAEIQLAHHRNTFGLDRLCDQLAEHHLFGEVLRSDDHRLRCTARRSRQ